jgi:D-alanyl-D-alanine carboxypeptidase (penicillin-binding protein 5/6)
MAISPGQLAKLKAWKAPLIQASALLLMDGGSGRIVYQRNGAQRIAPASLTKIMTAILALERGDLQAKVRITREHLMWGSTMGLSPGEAVSIEGLLWGMLLPSGNDAALAIASHLGGGSTNVFVGQMNVRARELGMNSTQFRNPHGLDEDGHYTTAEDLARLTRHAMTIPLFAKMVASTEHVVAEGRGYSLQNSNELLRRKDRIPGIDGVKTGLTDGAGDCVILSVNRGGNRLIAVVTGTDNRARVGLQFLDFVAEEYAWAPLRLPRAAGSQSAETTAPQLKPTIAHGAALLSPWEAAFVRPVLSQASPSTRAGISYYLGSTRLASLPHTGIAAPN